MILALIGTKALWLLLVWLASAIAGAWLSDRKGYGERVGLGTGLLLTAAGPVLWLLIPAKPDSVWKTEGPIPRRRRL